MADDRVGAVLAELAALEDPRMREVNERHGDDHGVNLTKLESYIEGGAFSAAMFFAEIEGHPAQRQVDLALEELRFFSTSLNILGVYPADPFRKA